MFVWKIVNTVVNFFVRPHISINFNVCLLILYINYVPNFRAVITYLLKYGNSFHCLTLSGTHLSNAEFPQKFGENYF